MPELKSFRQLLGQILPPGFRQQVLEVAFTEKGARDVLRAALGEACRQRNLRPQVLETLPRLRRMELLTGSLLAVSQETNAMQMLQIWFLTRARPLLAHMMDAWKIPHKDGEIEESTEIPALDEEAVRGALITLDARWERGPRLAYLGYHLLAPSHESWPTAMRPLWDELLAAQTEATE